MTESIDRMKTLLDKLVRTDSRCSEFFDKSMDLFCIASKDRLEKVNGAWTALLGWTEKELLEKPWIELVHAKDRKATIQLISRLERRGLQHFKNRLLTKSGGYKWISWTASPITEGVTYAVGKDITGLWSEGGYARHR